MSILDLARRVMPAAMCGTMLACAAPVETGENVEAASQSLFSFPSQGEIGSRETVTGVLNHGDFGHAYSFQAAAGETVTFALEFEDVGVNWLGAAIQVRDEFGSLVAKHKTTESNQAHITHTFSEAGAYRVYVKHARFALFGAFPYVLGANPDLCVTHEGTYSGFEEQDVKFFVAANFPERVVEDPWSTPFDAGDEDFTVERSEVIFGDCAALVRDDCGSEGPEVFEISFPAGETEIVANACVMRNDVFEAAGAEEGWLLWWDNFCFPLGCEESQ